MEDSTAKTKVSSEPNFVNFDEQEESTKIKELILLEVSYFKRYIILPMLTICTFFFILLPIWWYPSIRKKFIFQRSNIKRASHLFIKGHGNFSNSNI